LKSYLLWWLTAKLNIGEEDPKISLGDASFVESNLLQAGYGIHGMKFKHTEIDQGDSIAFTSINGKGLEYLEKLKQGIIAKNLELNNLKTIKLANEEGGEFTLHVKREGNYYRLYASPNQKKYVPRKLLPLINPNRIYTSISSEDELIKRILILQYIKSFELNYPKEKAIVDKLKSNRYIRLKESYRFYCQRDNCLLKRPTKEKKCRCGSNKFKQYLDGHSIDILHKNIISDLQKILRSLKIASRTMRYNYFSLKNCIILRVKLEDPSYFVFTLKSLSNEEIDHIKLLGVPMIFFTYKGEFGSTFPDGAIIKCGEFITNLLEKNKDFFKTKIQKISESTPALRSDAFSKGLDYLKGQEISPLEFERAIFAVFNYIFEEVHAWGGPKLADGSFPLRTNKGVDYLIWDAKRYDTSSLVEYIKKKGPTKDINYIKKLTEDKVMRKNGRLGYYLFVTSNTSKNEFEGIKTEFTEQIKKSRIKKDYKKIKVLCLNKPELLKLVDLYTANEQRGQIQLELFNKILIKSFSKSEGYFDFEYFKTEFESKKGQIYPSVQELRKAHDII